MSIEVDASQALIGGVGAFGLPNTPASFVDSIRLTFGLANLAEMVAAAKAGRQMKGDVKGTLYVELTLPSMLGLPKGKADVVLQLSVTARLEPSPQGLRLNLKNIQGLGGVLVSQQAWRGLGVARESGYTGLLFRTSIDPVAKRFVFGITPLGGQADGLLKQLGKSAIEKRLAISTPFLKLNGYLYDTKLAEGAGQMVNPLTARLVHEVAGARARATVNAGRLGANLLNGLSEKPKLMGGEPFTNLYAGSGYLTVGVPIGPSGLVIGPAFGFSGGVTTVGDGKSELVLKGPLGGERRIDARMLNQLMQPVVKSITEILNVFRPNIQQAIDEGRAGRVVKSPHAPYNTQAPVPLNFGISSFARQQITTALLSGESPFALIAHTMRTHQARRVQVFHHGNPLMAAIQPVVEMGVARGLISPFEVQKMNLRSAQAVVAALLGEPNISSFEFQSRVKRLANPITDWGSIALRMQAQTGGEALGRLPMPEAQLWRDVLGGHYRPAQHMRAPPR